MEITELEGPQKSVSFKFPECPRSGREVLKAEGLAKRYGHDVSFVIERGQRVALVGVNGAGKSTLMRLLDQIEEPTAGRASLGLNVKKAYFSQESAQNLDYSRTIWQEVNNTGSKLLEGEKRNLLGAFLFSGDEQARLRPLGRREVAPRPAQDAALRVEPADTRRAYEPPRLRHEGAFSESPARIRRYDTHRIARPRLPRRPRRPRARKHDRAFLDDLVDRVLEIRDGSVYDYPGNYSWFIEKRAEREARAAAERAGEAQPEKAESKTKEQKRAEAEERNRLYRAKKGFVDRLKAVEDEISKGEARKTEINELLCSQEVLSDSGRIQELMIELKEKENSLKALYDEWEELSLKIEEIK